MVRDAAAGQGRPEEADRHYTSAREILERIGGLGWLAQLDERRAGAVLHD